MQGLVKNQLILLDVRPGRLHMGDQLCLGISQRLDGRPYGFFDLIDLLVLKNGFEVIGAEKTVVYTELQGGGVSVADP